MLIMSIRVCGIVIALTSLGVFTRAFFPGGGFEILMLSYWLSSIGGVVSIIGLIFDRKKQYSGYSLMTCCIPWIFFLLTYFFRNHGGVISFLLNYLDRVYSGN